MRIKPRKTFLSLLLGLMAVGAALGQEPAVKVSGVVVDWQYARVLPTTIVFKSEGVTKEFKVDDNGAYKVELPPGRYVVEVTAPNFRKRRVKLKLEPGADQTLNFMLDVVPQSFHCPKGSICL